MGYGGGQNNIRQEIIKQTYLFYPKHSEQERIATFLDERCGEIGKLEENIRRQISLLGKYRKSLIHECVTGKRRITEEDIKELRHV